MSKFFMPSTSLIGKSCINDVISEVKAKGFKKALIVCDKVLVETGLVAQFTNLLDKDNLAYAIYDGTMPNPTTKNVEDGLNILNTEKCDYVITFGGGSPHDCGKAIALVGSNGGDIKDYEGVNKSSKPSLPIIAVNTTAGTASEMTVFCIITDETRHIKMAIVDVNVLPILSVNDPGLMTSMPKGLTAATGMDALTHAVEAYVSTAATHITDACAVKAVKLVFENLEKAVFEGNNIDARENMAYAQYLAGMAFSNASLGYVHAMAHQLGGFYNLPHGVCNAILLPHVCEFNKQVSAKRFAELGREIGLVGSSDDEVATMFINKIKELSKKIEIPSGLKAFDVFKEEDIATLTANALKDACGLTNPIQANAEQITGIYKNAM